MGSESQQDEPTPILIAPLTLKHGRGEKIPDKVIEEKSSLFARVLREHNPTL
jgi:hypothetical protein